MRTRPTDVLDSRGIQVVSCVRYYKSLKCSDVPGPVRILQPIEPSKRVGVTSKQERADMMNTLQQMLRHPAGRVGVLVGLALGFVVAAMGKASKAILFLGLYRFLLRRFTRS